MTTPEELDATEKKRRKAILNHSEQMADAMAQCVPCKLCGGKAIITDAGPGHGYYIECEKAAPYTRQSCLQSGVRISGWAYNVSDLWNRLNAPADDVTALRARVAELEADKGFIIAERDRTFALMLARAERAEAELARIRAALVSPGDGWRSMDSAPKDGRTVLLHGLLHQPSIDAGNPETVMAYWTEYNGGGWVWHGSLAITFTHWMPLPAPPASEGA